MGLDLNYSCGDREFSIRLGKADWDTFDRLRGPLPEAVRDLVDVRQLGEETVLPLLRLRAALDQIDNYVRDHSDLLPYTYEFKCDYIPVGPPEEGKIWEMDHFSSGGQSGFRLPGDELHCYCIWAGFDECRLEKMAIGPDGRGKIVEVRDIRGESEIQTANCGLVQIRQIGRASCRERV